MDKIGNYFDYMSSLKPSDSRRYMRYRHVKIMCTIGPSSRSSATLLKMMEAGMNIARIKLGSGNYESDRATIKSIKEARVKYQENTGIPAQLAIAVDIIGPEVRVGNIESGLPFAVVTEGETVLVTSDPHWKMLCGPNLIYVDYPYIETVMEKDNIFAINWGEVELKVDSIKDQFLNCSVIKGGKYYSRNVVNFTYVTFPFINLTSRDRADIHFALEEEVDIIIVSLTRNAQTINQVKHLLGTKGQHIAVVAKIQDSLGFDAFSEICQIADGFSIGRKHLGVNITSKKLTTYQKILIARCNKLGKPVAIEGDVFNSLNKYLVPKTNEIMDVANAISDGVDCVILNKITSLGRHPVETVKTTAGLLKEAEICIWKDRQFREFCLLIQPPLDALLGICVAATEAAARCFATAILVITRSGRSAKALAKVKPQCPILAIMRNEARSRTLLLYKSVVPIVVPAARVELFLMDLDHQFQDAVFISLKQNVLKVGDKVILLMPYSTGDGFSNCLKLTMITEKKQRFVV